MEQVVYGKRDPNENDWKCLPCVYVNIETDSLFIKTPKGWLKIPTEYAVFHSRPERSKREDSQTIDEWLNSPASKQGFVELGTCSGIRFMTSEGIKCMEPGKSYDQNLNEL